jgi:hypothetical protein
MKHNNATEMGCRMMHANDARLQLAEIVTTENAAVNQIRFD